MAQPSLSVTALDASVVLVADDLIGGDVIDPRDYAEAIARVIPARLTAEATQGDMQGKTGILFEVRMGDKLLVRLPKDEAIAFLDGIVAGINVTRGWNDNSNSRAD